jgi:hypothetical protein
MQLVQLDCEKCMSEHWPSAGCMCDIYKLWRDARIHENMILEYRRK